MMYLQFPLSVRNVQDLLHERGIDISHETVRFWWNRFGPMLASEIKQKRATALIEWRGLLAGKYLLLAFDDFQHELRGLSHILHRNPF